MTPKTTGANVMAVSGSPTQPPPETLLDVLNTESGAVISQDGVYRYSLTRVWDSSLPLLGWCGLNPSTADWTVNDPTIRKEIKFSKRWGFGGLRKWNLFGARATDPKRLPGFRDPIGPDNDAILWAESDGLAVVAAWGASVPDYWRHRAAAIGRRLRAERECYVLGLTKDGHPRHPLYMRDDTDLTRWASVEMLSQAYADEMTEGAGDR